MKFDAKFENIIQKDDSNAGVISELFTCMKNVDIKSSEAQLNITSISDGNGGRIFL